MPDETVLSKVDLRLSLDLRRRAERIAAAEDRSLSAEIRRALRRHVETRERELGIDPQTR